MKSNKYEIDMCNGSIMDKLVSFALPLMLSGILQLMFNAVDIIVVGRFSGSEALAAVGSTTALINVFSNLFIGISLGANVLAARFFAAGRKEEMSETVHTSITLALISGILMAFVGLVFSKGALELMGTPEDVIGLSTLYMRIYFMGMPFFSGGHKKTIVFSDHRRSDQRRLKYGISDCIWTWSCGSWNRHRVFPDGFLCAGFDLSLQNRGKL